MQSCSSTNLLNNTSAAPETIAINEDIVTEILIRVPVKPLLRFKCVSKRWLSLISDPRFCRRHHHHHHRLHRTSLSGIFLSRRTPSHFQFVPLGETRTRPPFTSLDFITALDPTTSSGIKISHSCNGLLLCRSVNKTLADQCHCYYYVCNAVTRQFSALPSLSSEGLITIFGLSLAFEPTESPYYHVVCVRSSDVSDYFYQLEVYSSETHAWRPRISPFVAQSDMLFDNGVFWNGGIHWLSPSGAGLCFDIEEEILGVMPSAPVSEGCADRRPGYFGASGCHLHLVEAYGSGTTRFKIFEMERDYTRWFVKYEVDLAALVVDFPETVLVRDFIIKSEYTYYAYIGVCVVRRKDSSILLLHIPGKIISYNLEDKSFKKLCDLTPHHRNETVTSLQSQFGWLEAFQYTETLACV